MISKESNPTRGYSIAMLSAVVLSFTAILARVLTQSYQVPPLILAFWRAGFSALTLMIFFAIFRPKLFRVEPRQLIFLVCYGLMLAVFNSLWTFSVALNGAAVSNVLVYTSAGFTALLGWWLLKEQLTPIKILVVLACLGGSVFVSQAMDPSIWSVNLVGIITGVLSGLWYAIYSLMGRSASQRGLNPWTTLFYTFAFDTLFLGLLNILPIPIPGTAVQLTDFLWLDNAWSGWGILFLLAAGPTVIGFGLYNVSLTYLPSSTANLILTSEPVITVLTAFFLLGEQLNGQQILGSALILGSVFLLRIFEGRKTKRESLSTTQPEVSQASAD